MSRTLVIHPSDRSTDFLKYIYKNKDYDVISERKDLNDSNLRKAIEEHDRIIMLGHGTPHGLIFTPINNSYGELLRTKETITIWCNSDMYALANGLKGFHTGMIISEVVEAKYVLGCAPLNEKETLANMTRFAKVVGRCIEKTPREMQKYIWKHYKGEDMVTQFNRSRIMVFD